MHIVENKIEKTVVAAKEDRSNRGFIMYMCTPLEGTPVKGILAAHTESGIALYTELQDYFSRLKRDSSLGRVVMFRRLISGEFIYID